MRTIAVVGKNFGDEGKGLVTANLCKTNERTLVVKHNGGGQAGHTVETQENRFVHRQIGSGAEFGADTLFARTFYPDVYSLGKEIESFRKMFNTIPVIYSEPGTCITTIDDVFLNMALESGRGAERHGSCGMGIDECHNRLEAGYKITVKEIIENDTEWLLNKLICFRQEYTSKRRETLGIEGGSFYLMALDNPDFLVGFAEQVKANSEYIRLTDADTKWLEGFDNVIFESGQGLLLDEDYEKYAPYLTSSKTGLTNPIKFLSKRKMKLDEVVYVTRTYVTRHGQGPLPCECVMSDLGIEENDATNKTNMWQGALRYAKHDNIETFLEEVKADTSSFEGTTSLCITHLDETDQKMIFNDCKMGVDELTDKIKPVVSKVYVASKYVGDMRCVKG